MKINPADVVIGKAGREKGKVLMVLTRPDEHYVLICDGKTRKVEKPKKKKIKHLYFPGCSLEQVQEKLEQNGNISNAQIRRAILAYKTKIVLTETE